jgi:hypothetical protein
MRLLLDKSIPVKFRRSLPNHDVRTVVEMVLTITVKEKPYEAGVDPYNKLIDRVSSDNRKQISLE